MTDSQTESSKFTNVAVRCRGLTKTYGEGDASVLALRGVDMDVRHGELLMIVGPSGCGKTTLISVIAAMLDQDAGECSVLGHNVREMEKSARASFRGASIGFVFQVFNLLPALDLAGNVAVPLLINGASWGQAAVQARQMLEIVGLGPRCGSRPSQLSGGQQQRVAIARALVHDPRLIVCDEPTSSLDHETGQSMMKLLRDVARQPNRALIVVTHDTRILKFADRIARMEDGMIIEIIDGKNGRTT